jgi:hypothetical protein
VFSTDRTYWTIGSRRVQQARPASDGSFVVKGLSPGEHYVCAVVELQADELYDSAFLAELAAASALRVTLADGDKKRQDLRRAGGR